MKPVCFVAAVMFAVFALSCASRSQPGRASSTAARGPVAQPVAPATREADVSVVVRGPVHARYEASVLGAAKPLLGVAVTNRSEADVDVSDLRVYLDAAREGIFFRCNRVLGAPLGEREPRVLAPGASFVFDRALDCALPLVGTYTVHVGVSFGGGAWRSPREVRSFNLTVTALPQITPREIDGLPGLWASIGSSSTQQGAGHGRTLLAIVNATGAPLEPPHMRLALRVYKLGSPVPCEDEPLVLAIPDVLGPGETHVEPIEVSCLGLSALGTYDILARLIIPRGTDGDREVAIGRLRVDVIAVPLAADPMLSR